MKKEYNKDFNIDELAKKYALTIEQFKKYLEFNNVDISNSNIANNMHTELVLKKIEKNMDDASHKNRTSLKYINIYGLFGKFDYCINFQEDISIWISENGLGKTTILNIIVAILTCDKNRLMDINFKKIEVGIRNRSYKIEKSKVKLKDNKRNIAKSMFLLNRVRPYISRSNYIKLQSYFRNNNPIDPELLNKIKEEIIINDVFKRGIEIIELLEDELYEDISSILFEIKDALDEEILFYPTYRRVEVGLDKVFSNKYDEYRRHDLPSKYVGFGMQDVKCRIDSLLDEMRKDANTAYVDMTADIISDLLKNNPSSFSQISSIDDKHKIDVVIKRIGEDRIGNSEYIKKIISDEEGIGDFNQSTNFLRYYIGKLEKIYDKQRPLDTKLSKFADICTKYLFGKRVVYDESSLTMEIHDDYNNTIQFEDLSSGEKQVVSIFSKVYLDVISPCIFIIDEPEISLSIEWQKQFLEDIYNSGKIGLLIATTHSPFIFKNRYRDFVFELEKYKKEV